LWPRDAEVFQPLETSRSESEVEKNRHIALRNADNLSTKLVDCINQIEVNFPKGDGVKESEESIPLEGANGGWTRFTEQVDDDEIIRELFDGIDADGTNLFLLLKQMPRWQKKMFHRRLLRLSKIYWKRMETSRSKIFGK
jgi:hypothetical protein